MNLIRSIEAFSSLPVPTSVLETIEKIEQLPPPERRLIFQFLLRINSEITEISRKKNVINYSLESELVILQLGASCEEISRQIERLSPENFVKLVEALAIAVQTQAQYR